MAAKRAHCVNTSHHLIDTTRPERKDSLNLIGCVSSVAQIPAKSFKNKLINTGLNVFGDFYIRISEGEHLNFFLCA